MVLESDLGAGGGGALFIAQAWGSALQSAAAGDLPLYFHWLSRNGWWRLRGAGSRISIGCGRGAGQPPARGRCYSGRGGL